MKEVYTWPMIFNKKEWSYIFYDWAESCFTVIVQAFIFPMLYGLLTRGMTGAESIYGFIVSFIVITSYSIHYTKLYDPASPGGVSCSTVPATFTP